MFRLHMTVDGSSRLGRWNIFFLVAAICASSAVETKVGDDPCKEDDPHLASRLGDSDSSVIVGLFDLHEGAQCENLKPGSVEQLAATLRWSSAEETSNSSSIGFLAYDTCSDVPKAIKRLIAGLNSAGVLEENHCKNLTVVGVIGPSNRDISYHVSHVLSSLEIPYFPLSTTSMLPEIKALVAALADLKWKQVALLSANEVLESEFYEEARHADICVSVSHILPKTSWVDSLLDTALAKIDETSTEVIVVLGSDHDVHHLLQSITSFNNSSDYFWLFAGVSMDSEDLRDLFDLDHRIIMVQRTISDFSSLMDESQKLLHDTPDYDKYVSLLKQYYLATGQCTVIPVVSSASSITERCHQRERIPDPLLSATLNAVRNFKTHVTHLQSLQLQSSSSTSDFANDEWKLRNGTPTDTNVSRSQPSVSPQNLAVGDVEVKIWSYDQHVTGKVTYPQPVEVGQYSMGRLALDKKKLDILQFIGSGWYRIPEFHCRNKCHAVCLNKDNISSKPPSFIGGEYYWRFRSETWLTVTLTLSCIGSFIALVLIGYLAFRTCRREVIDSNQGFAIVTLLAVIFAYSCTFLFALIAIQKTTRIIVLGVAYATMFAPIISRCFVIIAAEMEGIPGHVSGLIQFALCFFVAGVQFAVIICYWFLSAGEWSTSRKSHIIGYLSYDVFLGLLWIVLSPFCARSSRGYREGLLLHVASVATLIVWIVWVPMFFLLPINWHDLVLCIGLVGTASMILLIVFLPRAYRMMTSLAVDAAQVSLRPVILDVATAAGQTTSIYESVNHGYNADKDGFAIDMFKDNNDHQSSNRMTHL